MSGPTIIDYKAIERRNLDVARRRWTALQGRADAFAQRCAESGHPECAVPVARLRARTSGEVERQCNQLESALAAAAGALGRVQLDDRSREVMSGLQDVLADLERREQAATSARATTTTTPDVQPTPAHDYARKIGRRLATLLVASPELEQAAKAVVTATDPARARILYEDLERRIAAANRATQLAIELRAQVAELRAQVDGLPDPQPIRGLLEQVAHAIDRGEPVDSQLRQARAAITHQQDQLADEADREFVRQVIAESLTELGYEVADVDVETPETLVVRQSGSHGLRARIRDGEIDLDTVRLGADADAGADRDAEDEFCRRMPGVLAAMSQRGVSAGVKDSKLPGLFTPETVKLRRKKSQAPTRHTETATPATRKRGAR